MNFANLRSAQLKCGVYMLCVLLFTQASKSAAEQSVPRMLFRQSYSLANQLPTFEHCYALLTLLSNSKDLVGVVVSSDEYEKWCLEMWNVSHDVSYGWDRVALEKNALVYLSAVNPHRALHLLRQIEGPLPQRNSSFPEDVRADGASDIFINEWNSYPLPADKLAALSTLEETADWLAQTGQYPYEAMGPLLQQLATIKTTGAEAKIHDIFRKALDFYEKAPYKFVDENRSFAAFLTDTKDVVSDSGLLADAARAFVNKLQRSPKDLDYQAEVHSSKGDVVIKDARIKLLFDAFFTIQQLVPSLAEELQQQYPELKVADVGMKIIPEGYILPGVEPSQAEVLHSKALQAATVREIKLPETDAAHAEELLVRLNDQTLRIQGYAALVSKLAKADHGRASGIYYNERTRLQELDNPGNHLKAVVALAQGAYQIQDDSGTSELTATALDEGIRLFEQDSRLRPESPLSGRQGFKDLTEIVMFGTKSAVGLVPDRIQRIDNISLKANLLSIEAGVMGRVQSVK